MAYETGTATNVNDVLDKLRVFAIAQGWTVNRWRDGGYSGGKELCLQKGIQYVNLWSNNSTNQDTLNSTRDPSPYIRGRLSMSYDSSADTWNQPDQSGEAMASNGMFAPLENYWFFGSADSIHVVVEISAGQYTQFGFGMMQKSFNYNGGNYLYGNLWDHYWTSSGRNVRRNDYDGTSHGTPFDSQVSGAGNSDDYGYTIVRADVKGLVNNFLSNKGAGSSTTTPMKLTSSSMRGGDAGGGYGRMFPTLGESSKLTICSFSQQTMLVPCYVGAREGTWGMFLGQVEDLRFVDVTNYSGAQEVTFGPDTWVVFPLRAKYTANPGYDVISSLTFGLAFKKVV